jgi:general nucleoside transport system ATP-binding protein
MKTMHSVHTDKTSKQPFLSMVGITKSFPGVVACDSINLDIYDSEIHALLGENGAGKSTLVKILYGFYRADAGTIVMNGRELTIRTPADARQAKIGLVFQDFSLIPTFTVAENIALFLTNLKPILDLHSIESRISDISARYQIDVDPHHLVSELSMGEQQKVEIIKLLLSNARILILDEPTRVLAPHEIDALFKVLENLKQDGYAIILITHKLQEVTGFADRVTVLRKGKVSGTLLRSELTENRLIELMFAKALSSPLKQSHLEAASKKPPVLELRNIETQREGSSICLKGIDLEIFPNEIVGIAGVSGSGQKELGEVVLGMERCANGKKILFGEDATRWSIRKARNSGVAYIPENPLQMAVTGWLPVFLNMALTHTWLYALWLGFRMDISKMIADARSAFERLGFDVPQLFVPAMSLSGGTLQRMTIARELAFNPRLVIASYLTQGLDVQSTLAAHKALLDTRESGAGILLISEDLDELFSLSDRLIVFFEGRIVGSFKPESTNTVEVGHLMTGSKAANG